MSDVLLERIAVALEKIATATQTVVVCEPAAKPRKTAKKEEAVTDAPASAEAVPQTPAGPAKVAGGFLDDDGDPQPAKVAEPVKAPEPVAADERDEKTRRAEVRSKLIALQKALDPERALKVLKTAGGCDTLISLKPEKFQAVLDAIKAAMPPKKEA